METPSSEEAKEPTTTICPEPKNEVDPEDIKPAVVAASSNNCKNEESCKSDMPAVAAEESNVKTPQKPPKKRGRPAGSKNTINTEATTVNTTVKKSPSKAKENGQRELRKSVKVTYAAELSDETDEEDYCTPKKSTKKSTGPRKRGRPPGSKNKPNKGISSSVNYDWDDSGSNYSDGDSSGEEYVAHSVAKGRRKSTRGNSKAEDSDEDFKCYVK